MINCIYIDERHPGAAELIAGADLRLQLLCGAAIGSHECERERAMLAFHGGSRLPAGGGALFIVGPPASRRNRPPGTNDYDHLEQTPTSDPGAAHELWEGYALTPDGEVDPEAQAFWKIRFRGCLEHNPTPDLPVATRHLFDAMDKMCRGGLPDLTMAMAALGKAVEEGTRRAPASLDESAQHM